MRKGRVLHLFITVKYIMACFFCLAVSVAIQTNGLLNSLSPSTRLYLGCALIFIIGMIVGALAMRIVITIKVLKPALLRGNKEGRHV